MNTFLLIVFLVQIGGCVFLERRARSITIFMWVLIFFYIWTPIFLEHIEILNAFQPNEIKVTLQLCILFSTAYALSFFFGAAKKIMGWRGADSALLESRPSLYLTMFSVGIILSIFVYFGIGPTEILLANWLDKSRLGIFAVIILWLLAFLAGQLILSVRHRRLSIVLVISAIFIVVALYFRTRGILGIFFISFIVYYLRGERIKYAHIVLGAIALVVSATVLRFVRFQGELRDVSMVEVGYQLSGGLLMDAFSSGDLSMYRYFLSLIHGCEGYLDCFNLTYLVRFAELLGLASLEVNRFEYYLYDSFHEQGVGGSLHPTLFGYVYGDFGWLRGTLFMVVLGLVHSGLARLSSSQVTIIIGFVSSYILFMARGSVFNATVDLLVGVTVLIFVKILVLAGAGRKKDFKCEKRLDR